MKRRTRTAGLTLLLAAALAVKSAPLHAQADLTPPPRYTEAVGDSIRALVADYERAWNTHDMAAWADLFTPNSDFVNRRGGWWRTRRANVEGHAGIHEMLAARGTAMDLEAELAVVDLLAPGVALVHVTTTWPGAATPQDRNGPPEAVMTWVVVETDGAWRIRAAQNTVVEPAPGQNPDRIRTRPPPMSGKAALPFRGPPTSGGSRLAEMVKDPGIRHRHPD